MSAWQVIRSEIFASLYGMHKNGKTIVKSSSAKDSGLQPKDKLQFMNQWLNVYKSIFTNYFISYNIINIYTHSSTKKDAFQNKYTHHCLIHT